MAYWSDLVEFIKELARRWPELTTGGLIGLAWLVYEKATGRPVYMKETALSYVMGYDAHRVAHMSDDYFDTPCRRVHPRVRRNLRKKPIASPGQKTQK